MCEYTPTSVVVFSVYYDKMISLLCYVYCLLYTILSVPHTANRQKSYNYCYTSTA